MREDKTKLNIIHTPCKKCVFAQYEGITQKDCAMGMLDKFKKSGYEVVEVYDDEQEFFVINNKKCIFMREQSWLDKHQINNLSESIDLATKENQIKYIVILDINENTTIESIEKIINSLIDQKISPCGIMVMIDKESKLQIEIKHIARILDKINIKWRIQKFIDRNLSFTQKIKAVIQSAPVNRFYLYLDPVKFDPINLDLGLLNEKIMDGLVFGCLNINNALFFSYLSWQYAKINKNIDILLDNKLHILYENIK